MKDMSRITRAASYQAELAKVKCDLYTPHLFREKVCSNCLLPQGDCPGIGGGNCGQGGGAAAAQPATVHSPVVRQASDVVPCPAATDGPFAIWYAANKDASWNDNVDAEKNTPIHIALNYDADPSYILAMIENHPEAIKERNDFRVTPLQLALEKCGSGKTSEEVVLAMVDACPEAAQICEYVGGSTMLSKALHAGLSGTVICKLLGAWPHAVSRMDRFGSFPVHVAAASAHLSTHLVLDLMCLSSAETFKATDLTGVTLLHILVKCRQRMFQAIIENNHFNDVDDCQRLAACAKNAAGDTPNDLLNNMLIAGGGAPVQFHWQWWGSKDHWNDLHPELSQALEKAFIRGDRAITMPNAFVPRQDGAPVPEYRFSLGNGDCRHGKRECYQHAVHTPRRKRGLRRVLTGSSLACGTKTKQNAATLMDGQLDLINEYLMRRTAELETQSGSSAPHVAATKPVVAAKPAWLHAQPAVAAAQPAVAAVVAVSAAKQTAVAAVPAKPAVATKPPVVAAKPDFMSANSKPPKKAHAVAGVQNPAVTRQPSPQPPVPSTGKQAVSGGGSAAAAPSDTALSMSAAAIAENEAIAAGHVIQNQAQELHVEQLQRENSELQDDLQELKRQLFVEKQRSQAAVKEWKDDRAKWQGRSQDLNKQLAELSAKLSGAELKALHAIQQQQQQEEEHERHNRAEQKRIRRQREAQECELQKVHIQLKAYTQQVHIDAEPPVWWRKSLVGLPDNKRIEIDPLSDEFGVIRGLFEGTDPRNEKYQGHFKIAVLERVWDKRLWSRYCVQKSILSEKYMNIPIREMQPELTDYFRERPMQTAQFALDPAVNECYLFHGAAWNAIDDILTRYGADGGYDPRVGNLGGLFGGGFYLSDEPRKCFQYIPCPKCGVDPFERASIRAKACKCDTDGMKYGIIVYRVLVGLPDLKMRPDEKGQRRRKPDYIVKPGGTAKDLYGGMLYDSVVGEGKYINPRAKKSNFREVVIYDQFRAYPEYVVSFEKTDTSEAKPTGWGRKVTGFLNQVKARIGNQSFE